MRSIRRQLLVWLLAGLLLGVAVAAVGTYLRARQEANALFDHQLQEMVASLTDAPFAAAPTGASGNGAADDALVVQIWDRNGMQLYLSQPQRVLPQHAQLGFTNLRTESGEWRVFSALTGSQVVQVAQPMRARRELAASMALRTIVPLLAVLPALGLLIWFIIARGAAHELRTPLTAVHLQAQLAERAATDAERRKALADLKSGLERATRLSEQLLTLARTEPGVDAAERPEALVDLTALAREVIAELTPLAAEKAVDLGLSEGGKAVVRGDAEALRTLLSNLIDNAVRYTPSNGRVDITVQPEDDRVALAVRDNGPGIAPAERARVFDRFYRGQSASTPQAAQRASTRGSGLGLAIVKRIADRHGAEIALGEGLDGKGLGITVRFPAATA